MVVGGGQERGNWDPALQFIPPAVTEVLIFPDFSVFPSSFSGSNIGHGDTFPIYSVKPVALKAHLVA